MLTLTLTVAMVHLLAVMSPGPDFVVCLKNTLKYSRAIGIWTALGFALGVLVHVVYCLLGIAFLISQSILLFSIIKFLGAGYLIYLGAKALLSGGGGNIEMNVKHSQNMITPWKAVKDGFLTNLLNPKATLYFLGFFSVVVPPDLPLAQMGIIVAIIFVMTFGWFALVATVMTFSPVRARFLRIEHILDKVFGGILILLGLKVATTKL